MDLILSLHCLSLFAGYFKGTHSYYPTTIHLVVFNPTYVTCLIFIEQSRDRLNTSPILLISTQFGDLVDMCQLAFYRNSKLR